MKHYAKKLFIVVLFTLVAGSGSLYAATVSGNAPATLPGTHPLAATVNPLITGAFNDLLADVQTEVDNNWDDQSSLAKGLGNATAYSSNVAPFDGYHGYDLFGIIVGLQVAAQFPASIVGVTPEDLEAVGQDIQEDGDVYAGVGAGAAFSAGLNLGFLVKGLYANVKFGKMTYEMNSDDMDVKGDAMTFGFGINYQFLRVRSLFGLLTWRGLSFGTGFIYNNNELDMTVKEIDGLDLQEDVGGVATMTIDPTLKLGYDASTYVIPLELHTAVKVLILNVNLGAGADLIFGGTDITIKNTNVVRLTENSTNTELTTGDMTIDASTPETSPSYFRPKLMAGAGLTVLGVHVNTNLTWYVSDGLSVGISAGFVW
jgi:hypothetical protein